MMTTKTAHPTSKLPSLAATRLLQGFNWTTARLDLDVPPMVAIEQLRSHPLGTFGRAWADHLDERGLQPFTHGPRRQQLHDGIHVLTGYDTDLIGEAEVQAFLLGAKFHVAHRLLLATIWSGIRRHSRRAGMAMDQAAVRSRLHSAYRRGQQTRLDPDTWHPEQLWQQPLAAVQAQFGL